MALIEHGQYALPLAGLERLPHFPDVVFDHVRETAAIEPQVAAKPHALVRYLIEFPVQLAGFKQAAEHGGPFPLDWVSHTRSFPSPHGRRRCRSLGAGQVARCRVNQSRARPLEASKPSV